VKLTAGAPSLRTYDAHPNELSGDLGLGTYLSAKARLIAAGVICCFAMLGLWWEFRRSRNRRHPGELQAL